MSDYEDSKVTDINRFREHIQKQLQEADLEENSPIDELIYDYIHDFIEVITEEIDDGSADPDIAMTDGFQRISKWAFITLKILGNYLAPSQAEDSELGNIFGATIAVVDETLNSILDNLATEDDDEESDPSEVSDDQVSNVIDVLVREILVNSSAEKLEQRKNEEEEDED